MLLDFAVLAGLFIKKISLVMGSLIREYSIGHGIILLLCYMLIMRLG